MAQTSPIPLWEARRARGLTVAALAARAGVSEATLYRIARGATAPRPHVVRRLAAALGTAPDGIAEFRRGHRPARPRTALPPPDPPPLEIPRRR